MRLTTAVTSALAAGCCALLVTACVNSQAARALPDKCAQLPQSGDVKCNVSIIELVANPALYDGKIVTVFGFLHLGFEDNAIYLHKEDFVHDLFGNGLWVNLATQVKAGECQDAYVGVEGRFNAKLGGHLGLWAGQLDEVTKCVRTPAREM